MVDADGTTTINGITFNTEDSKVFVLGMVAGLQYNDDTYGKCFYTGIDTLNFLDYFKRDY